MGKYPGSWLNIPDHFSESLETVFWIKKTLMRILFRALFGPGSGSGMEKFRPVMTDFLLAPQ
jgi:hypothetical protein